MPNKLRIQSALICGDIRQESNGTTFLVGIYSGDMVFSGEPIYHTKQSLWLQMEALYNDACLLKIRGTFNNKKEIFSKDFGINSNIKGKIFSLSYKDIDLHFESVGILRVDVREEGGRWRKILTQNVIARENPSISFVPPS